MEFIYQYLRVGGNDYFMDPIIFRITLISFCILGLIFSMVWSIFKKKFIVFIVFFLAEIIGIGMLMSYLIRYDPQKFSRLFPTDIGTVTNISLVLIFLIVAIAAAFKKK